MSQGCGYNCQKCPFDLLNQNNTTLCLKDHHSQLNAECSPQSIPIKTHSFLKAKTHTNTSRSFCHTAHTRAHLISCMGRVTIRHDNHIHALQTIANFRTAVRPVPSITPTYSASLTGMASCLTSCHAPTAIWRGSKVTPHPGYAHLSLLPDSTPQCPSIDS